VAPATTNSIFRDPVAMTVKSFGYSWLQYTRLESSGATFIPTAGSMAFDGSEEEVKLGVGAIEFKGVTDSFDKAYPHASCTTGDGSSLDFALDTVVVDKSKVRPILLPDAALVSGFVMSGTMTPKIKTPFTFRSTKIAGRVYRLCGKRSHNPQYDAAFTPISTKLYFSPLSGTSG
jgi:hypothetical protein